MAIGPVSGCSDCAQEPSLTAQALGARHVRESAEVMASPPAPAIGATPDPAAPRVNPPHLGQRIDVSA